MPRRTDINTVLLIGSGPIVIGQACEFDYSGTQACKALKEEGYRVVLVNSNPATIMTDPGLVDATYIEPITLKTLEAIIEQEKPDVILPTMGGQTALNMAVELHEHGVLQSSGIELIGASIEAINKAENRELFRSAMKKIGVGMPSSIIAHSIDEALAFTESISYPIIVRPSFTMGGAGGGIARDEEELTQIVLHGLTVSPTSEILVEQSVIGWKEFELEVMRDNQDNTVIICSIENLDPMGVHTGDSITVAPAQTLTDWEYQNLRDMSIKIMREIGVETGGSNVQFAVNPEDGEILVIEMNPRVSRSSALASKATGFPIAKIATKLAVGFSLDEIPNDITQKTPACFEPSIDYVVTKIPRFAFEKFPLSEDRLGTQMQSVGEVMAIGATFRESFQKALRSLESGHSGLNPPDYADDYLTPDEILEEQLQTVSSKRIWYVADAMRRGWTNESLNTQTGIDPWFLWQIRSLIEEEENIVQTEISRITPVNLKNWKRLGFSDQRIAELLKVSEDRVNNIRHEWNILPVFKQVDTCAAEFTSETPYYYSTFAEENESLPTEKAKVLILGSGPNRIGQGIEFDYCCVHAAWAVRELGYEAVMLNCNPETVSTDYDTSDRLYFEPITFEDVMHVIDLERPLGVIVQLGGQTPLKLAQQLDTAGVRLLGTSYANIDRAEDRERFADMLKKLNLKQPRNGLARSLNDAENIAAEIGYPILVRPSYVLGGRAMMVAESKTQLAEYFQEAIQVSPDHPVLIDQFLQGAVEIDMDLLGDGDNSELAGIMEHVERAGIHSGDSACILPPQNLSESVLKRLEVQGKALAKELCVKGLMNIQFAVKDDKIFLIEVNPRASRTVPFVSKAIGHPLAKYATWLMLGQKLKGIGFSYEVPETISVKETVFPFVSFSEADTELGPEMKSTGEVMGRGNSLEEAFMKSQIAAFQAEIKEGHIFIGVSDRDKEGMIAAALEFEKAGRKILATEGTYQVLEKAGILNLVKTSLDRKVPENIFACIDRKEVALIVNTTRPRKRSVDATHIRRVALLHKLPYFTTVEGTLNLARAMSSTNFGSKHSYQPLNLPQ
ncbi:MAG: carbamoyl-phosphate synthase large subunit [SAR324 cluster bacterium]|nr:carbamoyl-phosphate synthase large subunit [SAR324 cluster bacterium]MBL7036130.1 carbamoyl-phosphate synthase large subunit [SAR324 cluster bacterium]